MKSNKKITFTVTKEEYDIVFKFFTFITNLDSKVYDDVREVMMDDNNEFYDMLDIFMTSLDYPKESEMPSAAEIFKEKCTARNCINCPLRDKCVKHPHS